MKNDPTLSRLSFRNIACCVSVRRRKCVQDNTNVSGCHRIDINVNNAKIPTQRVFIAGWVTILGLCCLLLLLLLLLHADCHQIEKTSSCAFCGTDTFACASYMPMTSEYHATNNHSEAWTEGVVNGTGGGSSKMSLSTQHLKTKVQQALLKLNRHLQVLESSNCTCVPLSWRCDGEPDCFDSSDEVGCERNNCLSSKQFRCATNSQCISKNLFCDGKDDCGDNSDENDCNPRQCEIEHETQCDNGRCIPSEWLCDLYDDCGDLSDERCVNPCAPGKFQCTSGECIPREQLCDSQFDCADQSDEIDCHLNLPVPTVNDSSHISCPASHYMCQNGLCISELYQCDGDNDCGDLSDEKGCEGQSKCHTNEFHCTNGQCINQDWRCDGDFDCDDMSDEFHCPSQICSKEQFRCRSGRCIRASWRCDGDKDCEDNSDEDGCAYRAECSIGNFRCRDGTCISLTSVCNGAPNCPDGSDEDTNTTCFSGSVACRENGLPCQHLCVATAIGHYCACKEGYRKGADGRSCIDIDECQIGSLKSELFYYQQNSGHTENGVKETLVPNIQVCSQLCANSVPGFQCSCAKGYRLRADKRRCKAIIDSKAVFLVANAEKFSAFILDSVNASPALNGDSSTIMERESFRMKSKISLDILHSQSMIFWTNPKTGRIYSALMELNQKSFIKSEKITSLPALKLHRVNAIVENGLTEPTCIAVDWVNSRLFWTDTSASKIEFANLDGSYRKVLFHQYVEMPHSIVLHPEMGKVFWSDWGEPPRIESAFMDASGRQIIVSSLLSTPTSLVIDYPANKLYWVDVRQKMIEGSNLDGSSRFSIVHHQLSHPVSLTLFEDELYWTNSGELSIHMVNKLTGHNVSTFALDKKLSLDDFNEFDLELKMFHTLLQPEVDKNPCHLHRCSHICLPNNVTYRCSCPFGYSLASENGTECRVNSQSLLLFTHRHDIRAVALTKGSLVTESDGMQGDLNMAYVLPMAHISFVIAFDLDPFSTTIFWSDLVNKSICRGKWTDRQQETLVTSSLEAPSGLAYDWATENLYWTDTGRNVIEVAKHNGSFRSLVVWRSLDQPRSLSLDPMSALMFWTQWSNQTANIERAGMDGSNRVILHSLNLTRPQGLALDPSYKRLYWLDSARSHIEFSFYDGSERRILLSKGLQHPFAMRLFGDFIYWSDLQQRNVLRAHKLTGEMRSILLESSDNLMDIGLVQRNGSFIHRDFAMTNACRKAKCSHLCLLSPQPPGYKCYCPTGIRLLADSQSCALDMDKYLIFTTRKAIRRISLETDYHLDVSISINQSMENAMVLDVHSSSRTVFWSDTKKNLIWKANILTGQAEPVVKFGLGGSNGLAVDNVGHKLYWTDAGRKRIEVANLDGSCRKVLISADLDSPRAIAVNHKSGHMVWSDWGAQVRIERADMDGGQRAILVNSELGWPNGITIANGERIIWADSKMHHIEMVDMNGANRRKLAIELPSPYGVTVMSGYLYWTDWQSNTINRIPFLTENDIPEQATYTLPAIEVFAKSLSSLVDIRAVNQHEKPFAQHNMCQVNNGGCSHLCLRNSAPGYSCNCPTGFALMKNSKTCQEVITEQLLLACKNNIRRISIDSDDWNDVFLPVNSLTEVLAIDYHFQRGQIFYIDTAFKEIRALTIKNTDLSRLSDTSHLTVESIVTNDLAQPSSLAVDWVANNLYWSDQERHLIEISRLDGSSRKVLHDLDLDRPKCLLVLPLLGFIFWINVGQLQRIERAFLDGSGRTTLVSSELGQWNGLALDYAPDPKTRLYWTDGQLQRIESMYINGTDRRVILSKGLTSPFSLAIAGNYVYWNDAYNQAVERTNRWSGEEYQLISDNIDSLRHIIVVSSSKQNVANQNLNSGESSNPCVIDNGACSHLCLFRAHGYICACPSYPDSRPCSTVPGEISPNLVTELNFAESVNWNNTGITEVSSGWDTTKIQDNNLLDRNTKVVANDSSTLKELTDSCHESFNMSRCDQSRFALDESLIQAAYAMALVLLSLAVLVCSILTIVCRRKLIQEESKLSKLNNAKLIGPETVVHNVSESMPQMLSSKNFNTDGVLNTARDGNCVTEMLPPPPPPPRCLYLAGHNLMNQPVQSSDFWLSPGQLTESHLEIGNFSNNATAGKTSPMLPRNSSDRHGYV